MVRLLLLIVIFLLKCNQVFLNAQHVAPDYNYGSAGLVKTEFSRNRFASANAMYTDSNGATRLFGTDAYIDVLIRRRAAAAALLSNGNLDSSFGINGKQTYLYRNDSNFNGEIYKSIRLENGDFILGGYTVEFGGKINAMLIRIKPNGMLDSAWGEDGFCVVDLGGADYVYGIVVFQDGSLIAACRIEKTIGAVVSGFLKVQQNGKIDLTYGAQGFKNIPFQYSLFLNDALLADSSHLYVAGYYLNSFKVPVLMKMDVNGLPDSAFNSKVKIDFSNTQGSIEDIILDDSSRIVAVGNTLFLNNKDFVVYRYFSNGISDKKFAPNGRKDIRISDGEDFAVAVYISKANDIYVLGKNTTKSETYETVFVKISNEGPVDTKFGNFGHWNYDFTNRDDDTKLLGMDKYGRLYLGGTYNVYTNLSYFMSMRLAFTWPAQGKEYEKSSQLHIYPNPASSSFYLERGAGNHTISEVQIILTNMKGQLVLEKHIQTNESMLIQLPSRLTSGLYNLQVIADGKMQNLKLSVL
jgi:Secretion system C-terminal sorting domain